MREPEGPAVGRGFLFDLGQNFLEQKADVVVAQAVVLEAAIEAVDRVFGESLHPAVHDEDADRDRHRFPFDQFVEDVRSPKADAVLPDVDARRFGRIVLLRHVNPIIPHGAWKDAAVIERVFLDFPRGGPEPGGSSAADAVEMPSGKSNNPTSARIAAWTDFSEGGSKPWPTNPKHEGRRKFQMT